MKLLVIGNEERARKYQPDLPIVDRVDMVVVERGSSDEDVLRLAPDADFILADAISPVSRTLIEGMPNLRLVHSEGVAFDLIDLDAARENDVIVCNNAGVNASAVAEQTILLMLSCLRQALVGDAEVRAARQIQMKERIMVEGMRELGDCRVGFIGFGAIGQAVARRLSTWGCVMTYNKRHPLSPELERELGVTFASRDEIVSSCDIVSLHVPVTDETRGMVDERFLAAMRPDAILINTARGEIVDQDALVRALEDGAIEGAGLDTLSPEPVQADNPLLNMSEEASRRIVLSPHIGGLTETMFHRAYRNVWENMARIAEGEEPVNVVS